MRFITEFELHGDFEIEKYKSMREWGAAQGLGTDIYRALGYQMQSKEIQGVKLERHTLEVEAFPMDKWLKFRNKLIGISHGDTPLAFDVYSALKELESHSNLSEH